jgi:hypothetical protein
MLEALAIAGMIAAPPGSWSAGGADGYSMITGHW